MLVTRTERKRKRQCNDLKDETRVAHAAEAGVGLGSFYSNKSIGVNSNGSGPISELPSALSSCRRVFCRQLCCLCSCFSKRMCGKKGKEERLKIKMHSLLFYQYSQPLIIVTMLLLSP
uniref:Uncharacterized protein n=1 Tax=Aplanochytrium stocchinoi TaxID=215587 RepID=A0A7S3PP48_9STRA